MIQDYNASWSFVKYPKNQNNFSAIKEIDLLTKYNKLNAIFYHKYTLPSHVTVMKMSCCYSTQCLCHFY